MQRCSRIVEEEARRARSGEKDRMKLSSTEGTEEGRIGSGLVPCSTEGSKKKAAATTKKKATANATTKKKAGKADAAKEGSTKRKAAAGSSKGKKAATGPEAAAAAGGAPEGEKQAVDVGMQAAEDAGVDEWTPGQLTKGTGVTRLCQQYVDDILTWEPTPVQDPDEYYNRMINDPLQCFTQEYIDESTEILRNIADASKRLSARFKKFQDWVSSEFKEKGYVEVDDLYIAQRVRLRQAVTQEDWAAAMARAREGNAGKGSILKSTET